MNTQLTVRDDVTSAVIDVWVNADDRQPAARLLDALRAAVGAPAGTPLRVGTRAVPADGTVADTAIGPADVVIAGCAPAAPVILVQLVVRSGPDAGRSFALPAGGHTLGRGADCDLPINDPGISRRHLHLEVSADSIRLTALSATSPTHLDGQPVLDTQLPVKTLPVALRLGDSQASLEAATPADRHRVGVSAVPPPRPACQAGRIAVTMPVKAAPATPPRVALLPAVVPIVAGVGLALVLRQWEFVAFTAMSPLMIVAQAIADRRSTKRLNRTAAGKYAAALDRAHEELSAALADEVERRTAATPDVGLLCTEPVQRTDDQLNVRLGLVDQPSEIEVRGGPPMTVSDTPLVVELPERGGLGVVGRPELRRGLARSLVLQAAARHDPADLAMVVLAPGGATEWGWTRWLPHLAATDRRCIARVGFDAEQVARRIAELGTTASGPRQTLVVVDGADRALVEPLPADCTFLWCASDERSLPLSCEAVASFTADRHPELTYTSHGAHLPGVVPDLVAVDVAATAARRLARQPGRRAVSALPSAVRWGELDKPDLCQRWREAPSTQITLGHGVAGSVVLDLVGDGPHALIAGTTGAGKSELLLTVIAELASRHRPDQLSLLLIDHKGGAALGACEQLPHTVGMVTDLQPAATRRALQSVGAELRRRERCLAASGVPDFEAYQRLVGVPMLTRLVIVVDEFAALVDADADNLAELVAIAQRGRSLGVHLVLATQRPEGTVSADIRANTRIRICLGVTRAQDSRDVIDTTAAAAISRTTPGRAYLRIGPGELQLFQAAQVTSHRVAGDEVSVTPMPDGSLGDPPSDAGTDSSCPTELDSLVAAAIAAAEQLGCETAPRPWLPPLPDDVPLASLASPAGGVAWGLVDQPSESQQPAMVASLGSAATTLIIGMTRSGRSTAAVALAVAMAATTPPDELHLWGIDPARGLAPLASLPHCGAVIAAADNERTRRLLTALTRQVTDRRTGRRTTEPTLLLLIDGWDATLDQHPERGRAELVDQLIRLASDGPAVGLHVMVTGERSLLTGRLASIANERIMLRLADPADYLMLGIPRRDLPVDLPPGRGVRSRDLAFVQIASPDPPTIQAANDWPRPVRPPERFAPLPHRIELSAVRCNAVHEPDAIVLGVSAEGLAPVQLSRAIVGGGFLVVGPRRAGRSNALRAVGLQLMDRRVIALASRQSPLAHCPEIQHIDHGDPSHALAVIDRMSTADSPPHLLVDDLDQLAPGPLLDRLEDVIRARPDDGSIIVVSATIDSVATAFRGPLSALRQAGSGLLLRPTSPRDGDLLGLDLRREPVGSDPPGRGWLILDGQPLRLQVALADSPAQPRTDCELAAFGARRRE